MRLPERQRVARWARRTLTWLWPVAALFGLMALVAFQPSSASSTESTPALNWAGVVLRLFLAFVVVSGMAYGGIWLLRRFMNQGGRSSRSGVVSVIATSYVAPKKQISIVRVFDRLLVVGVAENGMSLLTEFGAEEAEEKLRGLQGQQKADVGFLSILKRQTAVARQGL